MEMNPLTNVAVTPPGEGMTPEDEHTTMQLRANTYALLAALLAMPPAEALCDRLAAIDVPPGQQEAGIVGAWRLLKLAAERSSVAMLDDEYHALFIGVGCGELVPYASWYLTGFMMDKPLALLREDLRRLGFERPAEVSDPEDHVAALCEVMATVIVSDDIGEASERHFFNEHLAPWMGAFFDDLQEAGSAVFYRAVGRLGSEFIALEQRYLAMMV
jgi:TorA maturation chaperone TorD